MANFEDVQIDITLDDGTEMTLDVLARFPVDDKQYIALSPEGDQSFDNIYLYEFSVDENGEPVLSDIEDDDLYERVCDRFDEILDEEEFELVAAEDEEGGKN